MRKKNETKKEMTVDEWLEQLDRRFSAMPFKEQAVRYLPEFRAAAQRLEWWKTCSLPGCRRARKCSGTVDPARITQTWQLAMPACCNGQEDKKYILLRDVEAKAEVDCQKQRKDIDNGRYKVVDGKLVDLETQQVYRLGC